MMPSIVQQQNYDNQTMNDMMKSNFLPFSSPSSQRPHYNDQDQYPSYEKFDAIVQDYLQNLSSKKRDKALIDQARYNMILQVLKDPRNTAVSTAQFRFWVKKMFQLRQIVCHDGKPVAMREQIYGILVRAHREAHHGGRDKTSALVRRRYSWIPKELIARFVRHCPFCISRRNGSQHSPLSLGIFLPATPPTYGMVSSTSAEENRQIAPSMMTSSSVASSNASYPEENMMMMTATTTGPQPQTVTWQSPAEDYYAEPSSFFEEQQENNYKPFILSTNLSVYYPQEFELKQNDAFDNMTFTPRIYNTSPSLSPSSSSTSATSSLIHPVYQENNESQFIRPQTTRLNKSQPNEPTRTMSLLSHHQSLF